MGIDEVDDVDVVPDAGSIGGGVVVAINREGVPAARRHFEATQAATFTDFLGSVQSAPRKSAYAIC